MIVGKDQANNNYFFNERFCLENPKNKIAGS